MGLALNLLLLHAVHRIGWQFKAIAIFLICFSVMSTSAGQTFMLLEKGKSETEAKYSEEVGEIAREIKELSDERVKINEQIGGTVQTLEDRYTWKNTLAMAETRKEEIEAQLKALKDRREKIVTGNVDTAGGAALYDFYSGLTGGKVRPDWFKLIPSYHPVDIHRPHGPDRRLRPFLGLEGRDGTGEGVRPRNMGTVRTGGE